MQKFLIGLQISAALQLSVFAFGGPASGGPAAEAAEVKKLADQLVAASTAADQDRLAANAEPALRSAVLTDLVSRAYQFSVRGEFAQAESLCNLTERLAKIDNNNEVALAGAKVVHANIFREYGEYGEALATLDQSLSLYEKRRNDLGIVGVCQSKGIIYLFQGDFARALVNFQRALSLAEEKKFRAGIIPALSSMGEVYREQGLPERALEFYERARRVTADDGAWNMAFIFNNIGMSYEALGDHAKAIDFIAKSRAVAEKNKMRPRVATSLAVLAKINLDLRHFDEARKQYEQSLAISRELREQSSEGRALLGLAETARRRGNIDEALARAREAIVVFKRTGQPDPLVAALVCMGRCLRARQNDVEARAAFEEAIDAVEKMRVQIAGVEEESVAFFETRRAPYEEMISLLRASGELEQAFLMKERASARALLDVISRGSSVLFANILSEPEAVHARELDRRITDLNRELNRAETAEHSDEKRVVALQGDLENARNARRHFDAQISAAHPELKRATSLDLFRSVHDFAALTDDGETTVLAFDVTDRHCYLFALRRGDRAGQVHLDLATIDIERAEVEKQIKAFRVALAQRTLAWQKPAHDLYNLLLRPAENFWKGTRRLIIVPDGPLWDLPFQALLNPGRRPLLEDFTISYAPSLSVLVRERAENKDAKAPTDLLVFANPSGTEKAEPLEKAERAFLDSNWKPLPEMEKEARDLEQLYHDRVTGVFVGDDAREEVAKQQMPDARLIQFATHGVLNSRSPLYSYLVLSHRDNRAGEDGMLEAWEVMQLRLKARLAVLSGCETARGRIGAGEGVLGLSWAFFVAGCPATIVSQWKVDSASNQPLMVGFHRELLAGANTSEALRTAALELRKDERYHHPFYWGPFVLIGDSR
jgi:CHAT domain-containing protein/Tfp pilus assembly protein PilF